jgi:hypothetical protein
MAKGRQKGKKAKSANEWHPVFLEALKAMPVVRLACEHAGISRKTAYKSRTEDAEFRTQWDDAIEDGIDIIEANCHAHARQGNERLMIFILKTRRRRLYGEKLDVDISGTLSVEEVNEAKINLDKKIEQIEGILATRHK